MGLKVCLWKNIEGFREPIEAKFNFTMIIASSYSANNDDNHRHPNDLK